MKIFSRLLLLCILLLSGFKVVFGQQFINYTNGNEVTAIVENNLGIWTGTSGGLVWYSHDFTQHFVNTHTNSNLPGNDIRDICKGKNNELWAIFNYPFCLGHFTGQTWEILPTDSLATPIPLMVMNSKCITIDTAGTVWIGTNFGILKYDGSQFTVYDEYNTPVSNFIVDDITVDQSNRIIAGAWGGLVIFDGQSWNYYSKTNSAYPFDFGPNSLDVAADGTIWFSSFRGGICGFDGTSFNKFDTINSPLPGCYPAKLVIDQSGIIWVSCIEQQNLGIRGGLARFDGINWTIYDQTNTPFITCRFSTLACMNDGSILMLNDSLYRFNTQVWSTLVTSNSYLPGNIVDKLMITPANDLWVTTYSNGISKINGHNWQNYLPNASIFPCVYYESASCGPDSSAYFSFTNCGYMSSGQRFKKYKDGNWSTVAFDSTSYQMFDMVCANDGDFWWVSYNNQGYSVINECNGILNTYVLPASQFFNYQKILIKSDSLVIVFGSDDAYLIKQGLITYQTIGTYPDGRIIDVKTGPDGIVYGLFDKCAYNTLYCFNGNDWSLFPHPGFQGGSISCFNWDPSGNLWLGYSGTGGGFSIYDGQNWTNFHVSTHPIPGGYYGNLVFDAFGNAWFGVEQGGLLVYNPNGVYLGTNNPPTTEKNKSITCYPNPSNGVIAVDLQYIIPYEATINVYNSSGSIVLQTFNHGQSLVNLNLSNQTSGLYLIKVTDITGLRTAKVILTK